MQMTVVGVASQPQYTQHRFEFYKEGNQKLFKILNVVLANDAGKRKLRAWIRQTAALELVCDVVSEEMTCIQKEDSLHGIAAITPEFIKTWTIPQHHGQKGGRIHAITGLSS
jgi:hypothetical protein